MSREGRRKNQRTAYDGSPIRDIQVAAERIERFTRGKQFEHYLADEMLRSAVERQFGIIGEALSRRDWDSPDVAAAIDRVRATYSNTSFSWAAYPFTVSTRLGMRSYRRWSCTSICDHAFFVSLRARTRPL